MLKQALLIGLGLCSLAAASAQEARLAEVMVGDAAPELTVGRWLKGKAVTQWDPGVVYVIDLWATSCAPCIEGMPHLKRLQKQYGEKVVIAAISIGEEDQALSPSPTIASSSAPYCSRGRLPQVSARTAGASLIQLG